MPVFILTLQCRDRPGIVRAASTAIADVGGNILENDQFSDPVTSEFSMRTRYESDVADVATHLGALEGELERFAARLHLRDESTPRRALVMVSRWDHCLADLLYRRERGDLDLDVTSVVSNHADCAALAARYDIAFHEVPVVAGAKDVAEARLRTIVDAERPDFIVLARYMQVLSDAFCADHVGRIVNIHHSFLPGFKGPRPYHHAYERGVKLIGATAHFVTPALDEGPIIEQDVVRVSHARRPGDLVSLGRDVERGVLSRAVTLLSQDRVALVGDRTVIFAQ
ncbi:MAG: formyltetrahydrofolate deformylase [Acidimicrobiales bacterium]